MSPVQKAIQILQVIVILTEDNTLEEKEVIYKKLSEKLST